MASQSFLIENPAGDLWDNSVNHFVEVRSFADIYRCAIPGVPVNEYRAYAEKVGLTIWDSVAEYMKAGAEDIEWQPENSQPEEAPRRYSPDYYEAQVRS